jgi:hypothetical protein
MRRFMYVLVVLGVLVPLRADALTLRDLVELTRAGLGDDVLLALIEVDRPVFSIDADTLKSLKAAGVSERVIVAVVRSGRTPPPVPPTPIVVEPAPQPEPQVVVIDHRDREPRVREVPVAVPVYIPVVVRDRDRQRDRDRGSDDPRLRPAPPKEPVYWGWGGKRRPDAWKDK